MRALISSLHFNTAFVVLLALGSSLSVAADNPWNGSKDVERRARCYASEEGERFCSAINDGRVLLVRNLGGSGCYEGDNWRHDDRGIYVSRGCQGEFAYRALSDPLRKPNREGYIEVHCESLGGEGEQFCAISNHGVRLLRRLGNGGCEPGQGWRHTAEGIYVGRGCRGVFAVERNDEQSDWQSEGPSEGQ